jgi:glycosyltransferase involved in cell wall biosynthesis
MPARQSLKRLYCLGARSIEPALVSCIVPVFNGEKYFPEAVDSILAQTYRPLEVVVADDGSTDGTAALVAGYGDQVRYLFQPNTGTAAACNLGLKAAQGDFIAFLAADDLWHPERLARQMSRFQRPPDLDFCHLCTKFLDPGTEGRSRAVSESSHIAAVAWLCAASTSGAPSSF